MSQSELSLQDVLYDKTYSCPICYKNFTSKAIKININQAISSDLDLYTRYSAVNPLLYDAIVCPHCGYAALNKNFDRLLPTQAEWIKTQFAANYKKREFTPYTSLKDAIIKHQLALACAIIKKAKSGELGYIALHIAWLYRDLNDETNELNYLHKASDALSKALQTEHFPVFNLEANTTAYILAALAYRFKDFDTARSYLGDVVQSSHGQLKERALDLKELIKQKK